VSTSLIKTERLQLLHLVLAAEVISTRATLSGLRDAALARAARGST